MAEAPTALEPAHEGAIGRLARMFRVPGRLVFAVGRSAALRALIAQRVAAATGSAVHRLDLAPDTTSPWAPVSPGDGTVHLLVVPPDAGSDLLQRLNVGRERIRADRLRVILWLDGLEQMALVRDAAPDLWAHRAGFLTFVSEEDLPVEAVPVPASVAEQLAELESRLAGWPAHDRDGRFRLQAERAVLLQEVGRRREARALLDELEASLKALRSDRRWSLLPWLRDARAAVAPQVAPHRLLATARRDLHSPDPTVAARTWWRYLYALQELGHIDELSDRLDAPPVLAEGSGDAEVIPVNRGMCRAELANLLESRPLLEDGLLEARRGFDQLPPASRKRQEARFTGQVVQFEAMDALMAGDWLTALGRCLAAARATTEGGTPGNAADALLFGEHVARLAGLARLSERWLDRALLVGSRASPTTEAGVLVRVLSRPEVELPTIRRAQELVPKLESWELQCDLRAAIGVAGEPDWARRALRRLTERHGYHRHVAARALARMELALGDGGAAARAGRLAVEYARRHGGWALQAQVWAEVATAHRHAGEWDGVDQALREASAGLARLTSELHPAWLVVQIASEEAALRRATGEGEPDASLEQALRFVRRRSLRLREHAVLVAAARFGAAGPHEAGLAAVELAVELGLPALEADAWLELAALSLEAGTPDRHALDRAGWWIDRIGGRAERRRYEEVSSDRRWRATSSER